MRDSRVRRIPSSGSAPPYAFIDSSSPHSEKLGWFSHKFRPHFNEWVFSPIARLVSSDDALMGFIVMACAIDYLAGFWLGESTVHKVRRAYTGFIDMYFPTGRYNASGLYESLRSGLLHMFTIENRTYALTHGRPDLHLRRDPYGQIVLNAEDFLDDLISARERYFNDVEANPNLLDNAIVRYNRDGFLDRSPLESSSSLWP